MAIEPIANRKSLIANRQSPIAVLTLVAVALLAAWQLWGPGIVNTRGGGDSPFLLQRTHQMVANLRAGVFPVRWMPDAAYGLGYPFFSYYAALPYYLVGAFVLVGLDVLTALKLVQTLGFVAATLAMYGWMRGLTPNRWVAWLAAVAYTVAPFHLVNVYVRGDSLSEFYAFVFYPLVLWALDRVGESANQRASGAQVKYPASNLQFLFSTLQSLIPAALAYAGLILTHNISAAIFTPFVLLYLAVRFIRKDLNLRSFVVCHLSLGFGILLAAWFWLPALAELRLVQLGPSTEGYFHYSNHFRALNLVQWTPGFDFSVASNLAGRSPFAMGLAQAGLALLGTVVLVARMWRADTGARFFGWFILLGLLISTGMITPLSKPLWDHLPVLPAVQFPWRFLSVQALFAAAATGQIADSRLQTANCRSASLQVKFAKCHSPFAIRHLFIVRCSLFILIAVILVVSTLLPLRPDRLPIGPADVTTGQLQLYELFAGNIGTTIRWEWLPNTANPRPFTSDALVEPDAPPRAIPLAGAALDATLTERRPTRQTWRVWGEGGGIAFPLLYWPGWGARVDGEPVDVWPVEGSGTLALEVPPGDHTVVLHLGRTPVRALAEAVSLVAVLASLAIVVVSRYKTPNPKSQIPRRIVVRWFLGFGLLALGFLALASLGSRQTFAGNSDLTMDFEQMPYLHHNPDGVHFGSEARLAGYTLSAETLSPGDTLTVTLDWADVTGATTATVRLVSPAAVRYQVEPLAEATVPLSPSLLVPLPLPETTPRGVYLIQVEAEGTTEYLRPVRVPRGSALPANAPVLAHFGPAIRLHGVVVSQPAPGRLAVRLDWSAVRPVAANYGISLRLLDADGQLRFQQDTQPGSGFLPTSMWRPDELVADRYLLALPGDLPPGDGYRLMVVLYQVATQEPVGQAQVGGFALPLATPFEAQPLPREFSLPPLEYPLDVDFRGDMHLAGYDVAQETSAVHLTLWWQALQTPVDDYTVFVHLFDPATEIIVTQSDAMPRGGTYPTSWWATGEVVSETITLSLANVPQGTYRLALGLYDRMAVRLPASGPDGQRIPKDRAILPVDVEIGD